MPRASALFAGLAVAALALAPGLASDALARAGGGSSMGSRGSMTFSAPPSTSTAPFSAAPMQRSMTQPSAPAYSPAPGFAQPAYAGGGRSMFTSGLMGGLLGAGIGGMLFGHGMFGGISGGFGFLGFLLQLVLIFLVVRWLVRRFTGGQPAFASSGQGMFARMAGSMPGMNPAAQSPGGGGRGPARQKIAITPADYQAFEQILKDVQAAWSARNMASLQRFATPEMVSYFADQLAEQSSRGMVNTVTDVRLLQGDLAEAWAEQGRQYATVAMKFSMVDVTRDASGRIVDGSPTEHVTVTEIWTFLRVSGGSWVLSAIQQAR